MTSRFLWLFILFVLALPLQAAFGGQKAPLRVAVAANFKPVMTVLAARYEKITNKPVTISSASTGVLYNQIIHGAPFDVFFSADSKRPGLLEEKGLIITGSRQPYARGLLVLWNTGDQPVLLNKLKGYKGRIAIANPGTAPYGLAAQQTLEKLDAWQNIKSQVVQGNSIQQTWQFIASGNVNLGLVARAQLVDPKYKNARIIHIPQELYNPIRQEMVILKRTKQPRVAKDFIGFLLSEHSQSYISSQGYQTGLLPQ